MGGIVGNILTAIFAQAGVSHYDGSTIRGGWLDHHYMQLVYHLADSSAGLVYSFVVTVGVPHKQTNPHSLTQFLKIVSDFDPLGDAHDSWVPLKSIGRH